MPPGMNHSKSNRHLDCKCRFGKQFGYRSQNTIGCPIHFEEGCEDHIMLKEIKEDILKEYSKYFFRNKFWHCGFCKRKNYYLMCRCL